MELDPTPMTDLIIGRHKYYVVVCDHHSCKFRPRPQFEQSRDLYGF